MTWRKDHATAGRLVSCWVALSGVFMGFAQGAAPPATGTASSVFLTRTVQTAMQEVEALVPTLRCDTPEVWVSSSDPKQAVRALLARLNERGWRVLQQGATTHAYVLFADPDPNDPDAVGIAGFTFGSTAERPVAFLARCMMRRSDSFDQHTNRLGPPPT